MKPRHLLPFLLLALALPLSAQKLSGPEQTAQVAASHLPFEGDLIHEGDTIIFRRCLNLPGYTSAQLYDLSREALLDVLHDIPTTSSSLNGHDRLMVSTIYSEPLNAPLVGHNSVRVKINICTLADHLYITLRLHTLSVIIQQRDGTSKTTYFSPRDFYPINPNQEPDRLLADWRSLSWAYLHALNTLNRFENYIRNADIFLPE